VKANVKYLAIYRHKEKYPIKRMCAFFEVSRSGYYDFVKRMDKPDRDAPLAAEISQCQELCRKTYGYRRVQIWLERTKHRYYNPKTVLRVMNKYGLLSEIRRRKKYKVMGQQLHKYANALGRDFHADRPNQKWVTDISYIHTAQGVLYLSMIRDLYDNSIVAFKTATEQTVNLVLETIKAARKKEAVAAELLLHSDQGFQYTSHAYFHLTQSYGISPSMSRRGNCFDNAMAENFFSILKTECIYRQKIKDFAMAKSLIDSYIHFYNHERIQLSTKQTPLERRRLLS
jgi:transposase InsO family protein